MVQEAGIEYSLITILGKNQRLFGLKVMCSLMKNIYLFLLNMLHVFQIFQNKMLLTSVNVSC